MNFFGLGSYSLADRTVWASAEVRAEIARFTNEVAGTNTDIGGNRNALISAGSEGTRFWNDWQAFLRDWSVYQANRARGRDPMIGTNFTSVISDLRTLVDRYNTLEPRFRSVTGISASARSRDSRSSGWSLPGSSVLGASGSIGLMVAGVLGVTGLVALAVLATQARALVMRNPRKNRR